MIAGMHGINAASGTLPGLESNLRSASASKSMLNPGENEDGFGKLLKDAVGQVNKLEDQARVAAEGLMSGSGVDVHQAMIAAEKASMAFDFALAVRNKAIQSYQSIMGMQF